MKKILFSFALSAALCLAYLLPVIGLTTLTGGCASPTHQKVAVTTLASTHDAVDAAYKAYLTAVLQGASTNAVPQVSEAYREFQVAFSLAILTVSGSTNAAVPQPVFDAQAKLINLISKGK